MPCSLVGKQKRRVKELIKALNFKDSSLNEVIFTAKAEIVFEILEEQFGTICPEAVIKFYELTADLENGEVLEDGRGRGTKQAKELKQ